MTRQAYAATLDGKEVPVDLGGSRATRLVLSHEGKFLKARSADFVVSVDPSDRNAYRQAVPVELKTGTDISDLQLKEGQQEAAMKAALESIPASALNTDQAVVVEIDASWLGATPPFYDDYLVKRLLAEKKKSYAKNVYFMPIGQGRGRLLSHPDAEGLFVETAPAGAKHVRIAPPGLGSKDVLNLPAEKLSEGAVPSLSLIPLAIYAGRLKDPSNVPQGFEDAYTTMAGNHRPASGQLAAILTYTAAIDILNQFALQPVDKVAVNAAIRYMEMRLRMLSQSA
jgi:hypothetical protein